MPQRNPSTGGVLLRFLEGEPMPSRKTVKAHYLRWRQSQNMPIDRCDMADCEFNARPIVWRGRAILPELDHAWGDNRDNRPKAMRLLCPMCHRLEPTTGGGNIGRLQRTENTSVITDRATGLKQYRLYCGPIEFSTAQGSSTDEDG